ncbi:DUF427 domain-containing protein [Pseudooceanicola sp. CBS1P-1]|uniref:DUF427 domain-containing protein n=1 Tax=Pseudooceanicola albus TaxID=2692189 RepID=A0A6L7FYG0_9RHOB|nr:MULTISPECIES: DUF427 domain-containing protein [Pseudooceanicola]MBT9382573.1 DUF427 domain-containing protein [Pseudooceanicola endophyticus]MXN17114.1 DUF427 domain-containing protein [Pseudooceanicola albus]
MTDLSIRAAAGTWSVRAGGAVIAESRAALELTEGNLPDVIYFPREDVAMAFLDPGSRTGQSDAKGEATFFSIVTKSTTLQNAAYSYEAPQPGCERLAGHIAFYATDLVKIERI